MWPRGQAGSMGQLATSKVQAAMHCVLDSSMETVLSTEARRTAETAYLESTCTATWPPLPTLGDAAQGGQAPAHST